MPLRLQVSGSRFSSTAPAGYRKDGAAVGRHKGEETLHLLIATISTPVVRPLTEPSRP